MLKDKITNSAGQEINKFTGVIFLNNYKQREA